ncbi:MAG TPA: hypothetical protein VMG59_11465 [Phycisphaerae bacterium]|nr:hypothetical protein [Phycisphaerae bacterium]
MIKIMRTYGKPIMAFLSAILMVTFLIGYTFNNSSGLGSHGANYLLGTLHGQKLTSSDLQQAAIDVDVLSSLSAVDFISGIPITHWFSGRTDSTDNSLQFYLLLDEAKQAGISPDDQYVSEQLSNTTVSEQIAELLSGGKYAQQNVEQALSDLSIIRSCFLFGFNSAALPSNPQLRQYITQLETKVQINYVLLSAAESAQNQDIDQPAPSSDLMQKLFNDYKNVLPWDPSSSTPPPLIDDHHYPFGYRYPDRVQIEFLKFDRAAARKLFKPTLQDVQAAYAYYQAHLDQFTTTPTTTAPDASTQPIQQSFDQVRQKLIDMQIDDHVTALFNSMTDAALHQAGTPWQQLDQNGDHILIPRSQWVSYGDLAQSLGARFGYTPQVASPGQWFSQADLESLSGIGDAVPANDEDLPSNPTFSDLALDVKELAANPNNPSGLDLLFHLQVGTEGPLLVDTATGDEYIYRVTAVSPAHVPDSITEVQSAVEHDALLLQDYLMAVTQGQQLAAAAEKNGLGAAAGEQHLPVQTPGPFTALKEEISTENDVEQFNIVPGQIPGLEINNDSLVQAAFDLARRDAATSKPANANKPASSVALDPQLQVVVMQLVKAQPMPTNELDIAMQMVYEQYGIDEPAWQMAQRDFADNWLSYDSVADREGFAPIKQ